ncbi:hypothetical protein EAS61_18975 [Bradyrhizobium zhanjiangense]|uniref:Uncharacterized protein n=1 Tax=Bradyrhizobium zhanjiangense TaxID=1325107 RepID=A0A4Q0QL60_9BRAD|nr:hypothetical protein EAS61_18975 [Bradyrhizobium zhanjiangense]
MSLTVMPLKGPELCADVPQILEFDRRIIAWHRSSATVQRRVDPAIRTTHLGHSIVECVLLTGT